jgi:hypothetical protein
MISSIFVLNEGGRYLFFMYVSSSATFDAMDAQNDLIDISFTEYDFARRQYCRNKGTTQTDIPQIFVES